ncbi:MAG: PQQ-dependent sugar dehydrogenase, partial [Gammaproteobacteria bacterium]|nr:PQQ-dependent sugar dehydrogenase [Gammaproteobacteria bacterium]
IDYTGARISPFREYPGTVPPVVDWTPSIAPAGLAYYEGDAFPEWRGDLFATSLVFNYVERVDLENGEVVGQHRMFEEIGERIRDVRSGPDGALYVLTDSEAGRVIRVAPAG